MPSWNMEQVNKETGEILAQALPKDIPKKEFFPFRPEETQLDRIEAKLDQVRAGDIAELAAKVDELLSRKRPKRTTVVDDEFRNRMSVDFLQLSSEEVQHQIALALAHKNAAKYTDIQRYVINWLKKEAKRSPEGKAEASRSQYEDDVQKAEDMKEGKANLIADRVFRGARVEEEEVIFLRNWRLAHPDWKPEKRE